MLELRVEYSSARRAVPRVAHAVARWGIRLIEMGPRAMKGSVFRGERLAFVGQSCGRESPPSPAQTHTRARARTSCQVQEGADTAISSRGAGVGLTRTAGRGRRTHPRCRARPPRARPPPTAAAPRLERRQQIAAQPASLSLGLHATSTRDRGAERAAAEWQCRRWPCMPSST